jgi:hypothetical protein
MVCSTKINTKILGSAYYYYDNYKRFSAIGKRKIFRIFFFQRIVLSIFILVFALGFLSSC